MKQELPWLKFFFPCILSSSSDFIYSQFVTKWDGCEQQRCTEKNQIHNLTVIVIVKPAEALLGFMQEIPLTEDNPNQL